LNFVGVDDSGDISVGEDGSVEIVTSLSLRWDSVGTEDVVEGSEGGLGPDDESSEMTSWGELFKVKSVDVADINTLDVSDSLDEVDVFIAVDKEGSSSDLQSLVSELSLSWSDGDGISNSVDIINSSDSLEESESFLGLFNSFNLIIDNEWESWDVLNLVSSGENKWGNSGSSKG